MSTQPPLAFPVAAAQPAAIVALHWSIVACVCTALVAMALRAGIDDETLRAQCLALHRQAGLAALLLGALRLAWRLRLGPAAPDPAASRGLRAAAALVHLALAAGLLAVPLLGWALSDARGKHPVAFGLVPLPRLAAVDPDAADLLEDRHALAAWLLVALAAAHILAALWHHWVRRDGVLRGMLPRPLRAASDPLSSTDTEPR